MSKRLVLLIIYPVTDENRVLKQILTIMPSSMFAQPSGFELYVSVHLLSSYERRQLKFGVS